MEPNPEPRSQAQQLYFTTTLSQGQIAAQVGVHRKTVCKWVNQGQWGALRQSAGYMPQLITDMLYQLLFRMGQKLVDRTWSPDDNAVNIMRKLTLCIATLRSRAAVNEQMGFFTEFIGFISGQDATLASQLQQYAESFITAGNNSTILPKENNTTGDTSDDPAAVVTPVTSLESPGSHTVTTSDVQAAAPCFTGRPSAPAGSTIGP